jgi:hypothetical protein
MTGRVGTGHPPTLSWSATRRPAEGFVYADVPTRLAAFLIDLLLAGASVPVPIVVGAEPLARAPAASGEADVPPPRHRRRGAGRLGPVHATA